MRQTLIRRVLTWILLVFLWIAFFVVFFYEVLGLRESGDVLTLIQTITELALIPIAIIGFLVTIDDLRKSQQIPELDLYWGDKKGLVKFLEQTRPISGNHPTPQLILHNQGTSIASIYQIVLIFPQRLEEKFHSGKWRRVIGESPNYIFTSDKEYISFPNAHVQLGNIDFSNTKKLPDKFEIDYVIYAEGAPSIKGKLVYAYVS